MFLSYWVYIIRIYEGGGGYSPSSFSSPAPLTRFAIDFADPTIVSAKMPLHLQVIRRYNTAYNNSFVCIYY